MSGRLERFRSRMPRLWMVVGGILILIGLHYSGLLRPLENLSRYVINPVAGLIYRQSAENLTGPLDLDNMTREELLIYTKEIESNLYDALVEKAHLQTLVDETRLTEEQLNFLKGRSFQAVTAKVVGRTTDDLSESIVVNRGKNSGVIPGLAVIAGNGLLVGTVDSVDDNSSTVLLSTSFNSLVSAVVQNEAQSPGMVSGEHNLSLTMEFIPQFDELKVGEMVQTSGAESGVPHGLVVGQIQEVHEEPGSLFKEASLRPLYDPTKLIVVTVLLP
ncbi:MAG: hypothetical protein COW24_01410 [Candidatus Kerfeldbacteria bacterium CG15_BIG_FIL_POST_REV_8_21_14_020_45_12]|uniref:Cell shape-determining protein MreC n=1 Tax=Candidatus Kerfeldbacteria bacterium CG15_BIG_FIL_POST_REV_8_21_14_020_45_12 TaxID=2014247 RepID=A0A2M7H4M7_9BACT|nr:MAG: hypothetical protein COW24_01410 [Candidatus Kerfeldbacteria bacterium CG15_BIG_FIL_POST_REV_8_21_14_020_45_12]PJA93033.1 MAG: hypothetical protein CO132_04735 [Candidatus Kerfeldbacteria bacterium CG_4_9_14_3_um_filter_45_8]